MEVYRDYFSDLLHKIGGKRNLLGLGIGASFVFSIWFINRISKWHEKARLRVAILNRQNERNVLILRIRLDLQTHDQDVIEKRKTIVGLSLEDLIGILSDHVAIYIF